MYQELSYTINLSYKALPEDLLVQVSPTICCYNPELQTIQFSAYHFHFWAAES